MERAMPVDIHQSQVRGRHREGHFCRGTGRQRHSLCFRHKKNEKNEKEMKN
jgi:hypothetical protein